MEQRNGERVLKLAQLRKSIYSLGDLRRLMAKAAPPTSPPVSGPPAEHSHGPIRHWDPLIYDNTHHYTQ